MTGARPSAAVSGAMPRPSPSVKRPLVSRCIVVAYAAVTSGWRVWWFVAAVAIRSVVETAPMAPDSVAASFTLKRSETNTHPSPRRSPSCASRISSCGSGAAPARV